MENLVSKSFLRYPKIKRLGDEENDGVLIGEVYVQEKIDGANTSIWLDDAGNVCMASRNQLLHPGSDFNGFCAYVNAHVGIQKCLKANPAFRLFGEWLVRHTLAYEPEHYGHFYLFDILDNDTTFLPLNSVYEIADSYDIRVPALFATLLNPSPETLHTYVGQTSLGSKGEGIVLKNFEFRNKFGQSAHAKIVTEAFKEDNALTFGGNNRHSDSYHEMYIVNKWMTLGRVQKVVHNVESALGRALTISDTPRVINTAHHDLITEEAWNISKLGRTINFRTLGHLATRKAAKLFHDLIHGHFSVAYTTNPGAAGPNPGDASTCSQPASLALDTPPEPA